MSTETRIFLSLALSAGLLVVGGCVDKSNPDMVDKRSVERWNLLVSHEAEKAYDYLTPGYRVTQTRENYAAAMNTRPVQWTGATFKDKTCDGDRCKVEVNIRYSLAMPGAPGRKAESESVQTETWIRVNGEWYFLPN